MPQALPIPCLLTPAQLANFIAPALGIIGFTSYLCPPKRENRSHSAVSYRISFFVMANHKSAIKRIRSNEAKRVLNRYQHKSTRTAIKKLRDTTDKSAAQELLKKVTSMLDRLAKKNIIHKNKAANNKSKLTKLVNAL
jgi:small subunit ribosomal protein S20